MIRRLFISIILALATIGVARSETSVEVSVPRTEYVGRRFTVSITVNNPDGNVTGLKAPTLDNCSFVGGPGTSTSSSVSIINGRMQSSETRTYTYTYMAEKAGTVKVAPITLTVNGTQYTTKARQFSIVEGGNSSAGSQPQRQQPGRGRGSGDFEIGKDELYLRVGVSASSVFEQQAVECTIKLYSSNMQVNGLSINNIPSFDGCIVEVIGTPQTIEWHEENVGGRPMYSAVVYRALLYPQRPGAITLNGGEYLVRAYRQVYVQDFFGYRPVEEDKELKLKPHPATINVKPLPEPKPADFSGAVGNFKASARLIGDSFKTNEASSLIYTVEGTGNIKFLPEIKPDFPSEFEVYDPSVENNSQVSGHNMSGTETIEYTFVPQSAGKFRIGAHNFVYFDPASATYKTIPLDGFEIDVKQGAAISGSAVGGKQDVQAKNTDIHHIKPGADRPGSAPHYLTRSTIYWAVYPLLIAAVVVLLIAAAKSRKADMSARRLNRAGKVARKRLSAAGKLLKANQFDDFYEELLRAMQSYLSDKLTIPASQLSRDNIATELSKRGADDELKQKLNIVLDDCEMARYTPQSSSEAADRTFADARLVINGIENLK